jgi:hypothetical protein
MFADDTKFCIKTNCVQDCYKLQEDLNSINEWSNKWGMKFNVTKCKVLTVSRKLEPFVYFYDIKGVPLQRVESILDLGITVDKCLKWNTHINNIVKKANSSMWLIKRTVGYRASSNVKRQLYISLVRSKLEYCTQLWSEQHTGNMAKLERVQRSATRYILNFENISYYERLKKLNMMPLFYRRDIADVSFLHQCIYENIVDLKNYVTFTNDNTRDLRSSSDTTRLRVPYSRTQTGTQMYFKRIVNLWNNIPSDIREINDKAVFKKALVNLFNNYFLTQESADFL